MSEQRRVKLASPYGSLLYEKGRTEQFIDNGEIGSVVDDNVVGFVLVRWDHSGDEVRTPQHWLESVQA